MKYVKLFENWLNEAEVAKPAPKFNTMSPSKTLVVDISQKNMAACLTKSNESLSNALYSFLSRGYAKKDPLDDGEDQIICVPCRVGYSGTDEKKGGSKKKYYFTQSIRNDYEDLGFPDNYCKLIWEDPDAGEGGGDSGEDGNVDQFKQMKANKAPVFYITKNGFTPKVDKDGVFEPSPGAFFLVPADTKDNWNDTFKGTEKDFALDSQFTIIDGRMLGNQTVTLGDLVLNIQDALNNNKRIKPSSPKPQDIAKALGYEIPDNYAPGQGVETKKA